MRRLADVTDRCRKIAFEFEKVLPEVNPANLMTLSTAHALKTRRDGFANGCPRGNNSAILAMALVATLAASDVTKLNKLILYEIINRIFDLRDSEGFVRFRPHHILMIR